MKSILLAGAMTLAIVGSAQAGVVFIPTITYPGGETTVGPIERWFGYEPKKLEDWEYKLEAEHSRPACEKAIYNALLGDFSGIRRWRCVPFVMPTEQLVDLKKPTRSRADGLSERKEVDDWQPVQSAEEVDDWQPAQSTKEVDDWQPAFGSR
jgi:hypothetical protein